MTIPKKLYAVAVKSGDQWSVGVSTYGYDIETGVIGGCFMSKPNAEELLKNLYRKKSAAKLIGPWVLVEGKGLDE